MIVAGIICLLISVLVPQLAALWMVGIVLIIVGLVLIALGAAGRPVGGRRWY